MPSVTKTIELQLSQEQTFQIATDPDRFGEWLTIHNAWPEGPPASTERGDRFTQRLAIMGMPAEVQWTVREHVAPERLAMSGSGPLGATLTTTISATANGGGTIVSYEAEFSGGGLAGPMGDMVTRKAGEELEASLAKLQALAA
jgi:uncharacterized protein YndB with AHSA1/START domain